MSLTMCAICREHLDSPPTVDSDSGSPDSDARVKSVCSTRCGHVFHFPCLNRWWQMIWRVAALEAQNRDAELHGANAADPADRDRTEPRPRFTCPLCGTVMPSSSTGTGTRVFELFITFTDAGSRDDNHHNHDELTKKIEELQVANALLSAKIVEATTRLAAASSAR